MCQSPAHLGTAYISLAPPTQLPIASCKSTHLHTIMHFISSAHPTATCITHKHIYAWRCQNPAHLHTAYISPITPTSLPFAVAWKAEARSLKLYSQDFTEKVNISDNYMLLKGPHFRMAKNCQNSGLVAKFLTKFAPSFESKQRHFGQ